MTRRRKKKPPDFKSVEEAGEWYDGHSTAELDARPASLKRKGSYDPTLTIRVPADVLDRLRKLAHERGMPTATLARMLLVSKLREEIDPARGGASLLRVLLGDERLRRAYRSIIMDDEPPEDIEAILAPTGRSK